jgi:hypothetical protein
LRHGVAQVPNYYALFATASVRLRTLSEAFVHRCLRTRLIRPGQRSDNANRFTPTIQERRKPVIARPIRSVQRWQNHRAAWLALAYPLPDPGLANMPVNPTLDPIRDAP